MRKFAVALAAIAAMSVTTAANAAVIVTTFKLDTTEVGGFAGTTNFGTVTVTDNGQGLRFDITLADPTNYEFRHASDSNHHAATFKLDKNGLVILGLTSNVTTGAFAQATGNAFVDQPFKDFNYAVDCVSSKCVNGFNPAKNPTKMDFKIAGISINDLKSVPYSPKTGSPKNIFFAVDLVRKGGATGAVGATWYSQVSYAPEPGTWALMILGFGCVGADLRRRRTRLAQAA
jgi:hypothetical protein